MLTPKAVASLAAVPLLLKATWNIPDASKPLHTPKLSTMPSQQAPAASNAPCNATKETLAYTRIRGNTFCWMSLMFIYDIV